MNKLIDTAIKLGKFDMLLNEYDLKEILSDDDISSTLAWMIFLWEELEKEKNKYMRKPVEKSILQKGWSFNINKLIRDLQGVK